jgi:hypothetical protein
MPSDEAETSKNAEELENLKAAGRNLLWVLNADTEERGNNSPSAHY